MHEREVVIKLRVEPEGATRAYKEVGASATRAGKEAERAARDRERAESRAAKEVERHDRRVFNARMKAIKDRERAEAQAHRARMQQEQQAVNASRQYAMAQAQIAERFRSGLGDLTRFGRGLAMMGIAGEENSEKLLRGLVKIQSTVDVISGGVGVWMRLTRGMQDYARMTQLAAAAHTALAAAQGRSAVAGGLSLTGMAAGGVAAASTAGILAGGAVAAGHLGMTGYEAATGQGMGGMVGRYAAFSRMTGLRSGYEHINELVESQNALQRAEQQRSMHQQVGGLQRQRGQTMGAMSALRMQGMGAGGVEGMMGRARGVLDGGAEAGYNVSEIAQAQATLEAGIQRRVQLYEEERRAVAQNAAEKAQAMQEELSGIQRTMAMHEAALERRRSAYQSAAERFALMDPMQQQQALAAAQAVRAGTATAQQAALARGLAGESSDLATDATRQMQAAADRAGFGSFRPEHTAGIAASQRGLETGRAAAAELENQMQATMEEARKTGETIGKKMAELLKERDAMMLRAMEDQTDQIYSEILSLQRKMAMRD